MEGVQFEACQLSSYIASEDTALDAALVASCLLALPTALASSPVSWQMWAPSSPRTEWSLKVAWGPSVRPLATGAWAPFWAIATAEVEAVGLDSW